MASLSTKEELIDLIERLTQEEMEAMLGVVRLLHKEESINSDRLPSRLGKSRQESTSSTRDSGVDFSKRINGIPQDVLNTFGAWKGADKSTEEIINEIYSSRTVTEDEIF